MKYYIFLISLVLISCTSAEQTDVSTLLPIIDTHAHIYPVSEELNTEYVDALVSTAQENGVSKIFLGLNARQEPDRPPTFSSIHDDWVLDSAERYPDIIVPTLNGFDPADPASVNYVREHLESGKWKMIGELDLRNRPKKISISANDTVPMEIFALAGTYGVPVMIHYDFDYGTDRSSGIKEFEDALNGNPQTTFIYAHTCGQNIESFMKSHENLYCEQEGGMIGENIDLSKVILGTDMQVHGGRPDLVADEYKKLIDQLRTAISSLPSIDQEQVATKTPSSLFGL